MAGKSATEAAAIEPGEGETAAAETISPDAANRNRDRNPEKS